MTKCCDGAWKWGLGFREWSKGAWKWGLGFSAGANQCAGSWTWGLGFQNRTSQGAWQWNLEMWPAPFYSQFLDPSRTSNSMAQQQGGSANSYSDGGDLTGVPLQPATPVASGGATFGMTLLKTYGVKLQTIAIEGGINQDFTPQLLDWTIEWRRNEPLSGTFVLAVPMRQQGDANTALRPWTFASGQGGAGGWNRALDVNNLQVLTSQVLTNPYYTYLPPALVQFLYIIRQHWSLTINTMAGVGKTFDHMFTTDVEWAEDMKSLTVTVTDMSELLQHADNQYMDDFITRAPNYISPTTGQPVGGSGVIYAKAALIQIFQAYGVYSYNLNFADFIIKHYSPNGGNALQWVRDILAAQAIEWWWDGATFNAQDPNYMGGIDWYLQDVVDITAAGFRKSLSLIKNTVVVASTEKAGLGVGQLELFGGTALGYHEIELNPPCSTAQAHVLAAANGTVNQFEWYDKDGNPLSETPSPVAASATPITKVSFIYTPSLNNINPGSWQPHLDVVITGTPANANIVTPAGTANPYNPALWVERTDAASQTRYGVLRDASPIINTIIATNTDANTLALRKLAEMERLATIGNFNGPANPFIRPAQNVVVTASYQGFGGNQNGTVQPPAPFYSEAVVFHGNAKSCDMRLELSILDAA